MMTDSVILSSDKLWSCAACPKMIPTTASVCTDCVFGGKEVQPYVEPDEFEDAVSEVEE